MSRRRSSAPPSRSLRRAVAATAATFGLVLSPVVAWACTDTDHAGGEAQHVRGRADKTESAMPQDLDAYKAFVSQVVKRYSAYGVDEYAFEGAHQAGITTRV